MAQGASSRPFARKLRGLDDIELRVGLACEELASMDRLAAAHLLDDCREGAFAGEASALRAWLALALALFEPSIEGLRLEIANAARRAGLCRVVELLIPPPDRDSPLGERVGVSNTGLGRPLTLGERKALARTHERPLIQRVVRDPHPGVVSILLGNPRLTEDDVIRVCAARPADPRVLQAVFQHRRWVVRYRPRNAIVRNPACPPDIALLLAPLLRGSDLNEVSRSPELSSSLRLYCKSIVEKRSRREESV